MYGGRGVDVALLEEYVAYFARQVKAKIVIVWPEKPVVGAASASAHWPWRR